MLHDFPELAQHVHSLYYCQYDQFFKTLSKHPRGLHLWLICWYGQLHILFSLRTLAKMWTHCQVCRCPGLRGCKLHPDQEQNKLSDIKRVLTPHLVLYLEVCTINLLLGDTQSGTSLQRTVGPVFLFPVER